MSDAPIPIPEDDLLPPLPDTATKWAGFGLPTPPDALTDVVQSVADIGNAAVAVLNLIKSVLDVLANITIDLDPAKAVLAAAIAAIEEGLKTLIEDSGVYILLVPVRRKIIVPPAMSDALNAVGLSEGIPKKTVDRDLLVVQASLAAQSADAAALFNDPANGGNVGFFRTVVEATYDVKDPNRPQFGHNTYVAGFHLVAGAPDYLELLSLMAALDGLLLPAGSSSNSLRKAGLPVPQNLKVQPVVSLDGKPASLLNWDPQVAYAEIPSLASSCVITHVAIIRSRSPVVLTASTPETLFGTNKLVKGLASPSDPDTVVVDVLDYADPTNPTPNTYDDYNGALEKGVTYYYHACYRLKVGTLDAVLSGGTVADQGFYKLSNIAVATATTRAGRSSQGAPPDWLRSPSLVSMFPVLGDLTTLLVGTLQQFKSSTTGQADNFKTYVKFLQGEIDQFSRIVGTMSGLVAKMTAISTQKSTVGLYARAYSGSGGVDFMLADLGASLAPGSDDPLRPPFDKGDEFVMGATFLIGGPSEGGVVAVAQMVNSLFGLGGAGAQSPLAQAVAAIDIALTTAETVTLGTDLTTATSALTTAPNTNPPLTDDGTDPGSCGPDTTPAPVFGDDFGVTT